MVTILRPVVRRTQFMEKLIYSPIDYYTNAIKMINCSNRFLYHLPLSILSISFVRCSGFSSHPSLPLIGRSPPHTPTPIESIAFDSMPSISDGIVSAQPPSAKQHSHSKFFTNRLHSHPVPLAPNATVGSTTPATVVQHVNKYFVSNVSSMAHAKPTVIDSPATAMPSMRPHSKHRNGTVHAKLPNVAAPVSPSAAPKANRTTATHFQIGQKQLILTKSVHTEPPPKMNDILESLSVSSSKHMHHDHRYVWLDSDNDMDYSGVEFGWAQVWLQRGGVEGNDCRYISPI